MKTAAMAAVRTMTMTAMRHDDANAGGSGSGSGTKSIMGLPPRAGEKAGEKASVAVGAGVGGSGGTAAKEMGAGTTPAPATGAAAPGAAAPGAAALGSAPRRRSTVRFSRLSRRISLRPGSVLRNPRRLGPQESCALM